MFTRIFSAFLLLSACSEAPPEREGGAPMACATSGNAAFSESCTAYFISDGVLVTHPDGVSRRFVKGAAGWETDGADPVEPQLDGTVQVGADRYRLP
jgi:hypothetical protein